jgi:hypothetical protein
MFEWSGLGNNDFAALGDREFQFLSAEGMDLHLQAAPMRLPVLLLDLLFNCGRFVIRPGSWLFFNSNRTQALPCQGSWTLLRVLQQSSLLPGFPLLRKSESLRIRN